MGTLRIVSEDGTSRVVEEVDERGKVICTSYEPSAKMVAQQAEIDAKVDQRRAVLRQQLDPNQADPSPKELADAAAYLALAADLGAEAASDVAGDVLVAAVPAGVPPVEGGARA